MWFNMRLVDTFRDVEQAAEFAKQNAPRFWHLCMQSNLFQFIQLAGASAPRGKSMGE
jgi:hypothetical protein